MATKVVSESDHSHSGGAQPVDAGRRRFLTITTGVVGAVGVAGASVPFIKSWMPSARAKLAGAPVTVDISALAEGQRIIAEWRGQPIWIVKRSKAVLDALPGLDGNLRDPKSENLDQQPEYIKGEGRSFKPEISVLVGLCTHLGCSPEMKAEIRPEQFDSNWKGGYFCPCHKSKLRHVRSRLRRRAGADQFDRPAALLRERDHAGDRSRPEGRRVSHGEHLIMRTADNAIEWFNARAPGFMPFYRKHMSEYYAPKNFNFWYIFGVLATVVLVNQIVTGIFLTMHFKPSAAEAFASVEYIMRDVEWRLADPLHAQHRRLAVLRRRLPAHVPRPDVRLVPEAARTGVDPRHADLPGADGRSLHGLRAAVGPDVVLGRQGDHLAVRCDPGDRHRPDRMDHGRLSARAMPR